MELGDPKNGKMDLRFHGRHGTPARYNSITAKDLATPAQGGGVFPPKSSSVPKKDNLTLDKNPIW
ncbi:MAG: hypothetical protein JW810_01845 [Sedimentisphaerales bacterium]|nr:hypothetical protein [Sedimentisphaerales bacterium]